MPISKTALQKRPSGTSKYVHLMTRLASEETIEAKQAFEHFAKQHGVRILHNHCNNLQTTPSKTAALKRGNVSPSVE
jgi:hypothetical protein